MTESKHCAKPKASAQRVVDLSVVRVASRLFQEIDTPVSLGCYLRLVNGEIEQLVSLGLRPNDYLDADSFYLDYQAVSFLKKYQDFKIPGIDRKRTAAQKFSEAEASCKETNRRFELRGAGVFSTPAVESVLFRAQQKISRILGPLKFDVLLHSSFGPGTTSSCHGGKTGVAEKFKSELNATRDALKYVKPLLGLSPIWAKSLANVEIFDECGNPSPDFCDFPCEVIPHNSVTFVPKTALTDRAIAVEPHLNIFFQKGVGQFLRERLKRFEVDLTSQLRNQSEARKGSRDGDLATVDLSAASDTVAIELVWSLLPYDWACFLDDLRSKYGRGPDGSIFRYEKWSSMGNGYTFELESMIFFALACGCYEQVEAEGSPTVYGDDIIVDTKAFDLLHDVLSYCGFSMNPTKSFNSGPFRESCGKDWFLGKYVRPFFLRGKIRSIRSLVSLANQVRLQAFYRGNESYCDRRLKGFYDWLSSLIPLTYPRGPIQLGDAVLISNWDESHPSYVRRPPGRWVEGFLIRCKIPVPKKYRVRNDYATLIQALLVGHSSPTGGFSTIRGEVSYIQKWVLANHWPDLGAWY